LEVVVGVDCMCEKKVIVPYAIEDKISNLKQHNTRKDVRKLLEENTLQNITERKVFENVGELDAYLEGRDVRYDWVIATFEDLITAGRLYLNQA